MAGAGGLQHGAWSFVQQLSVRPCCPGQAQSGGQLGDTLFDPVLGQDALEARMGVGVAAMPPGRPDRGACSSARG